MEEIPKVNVQAVVEALMERIAALELEVAVLKSLLESQQQELPEAPPSAPRPEKDAGSGNYL